MQQNDQCLNFHPQLFTPFVIAGCCFPYEMQNKTETLTKCLQNMALCNTCDLNDVHYLECWTFELTLVMHKQQSIATMNLVAL